MVILGKSLPSDLAMDVDDVEVVPCSQCHKNIDLSDAARRRRTTVPSWVRCSFCMDVYHSECANIPSKCTRLGFYEWQCNECKVCQVCQKDEADGMLFCDGCDRGYHGKCLNPPVNVSEGDETPFLCKDCIEAKHTTRGFRRTKLLGCDTRRQLLLKKDSPKKKLKTKPPRKIRQRRSESLEAENDSSSIDEAEAHVSDPLPKTCVARGCDGTGHLNGVSGSHNSLMFCPIYNRLDKNTALLYTEVVEALENTSIKRSKDCKEMLDTLSVLADKRLNPTKKSEKLTKPTDVLLAPELKGVSGFSKALFEMSKISHAKKLDEQNIVPHKQHFFIEKISIGPYVVDVHETSATIRDEPLQTEVYFCDICLDISHEKIQYTRHTAVCDHEFSGERIYSKNDLAIFEIDGRVEKTFCQNLSLLSRFFLATKAVCYDVIYMMYYVLVQRGADGRYRPVGYFSKDKDLEKNTLACILVFPQYENQGFGKLLIDLSYVIARTTHKPGTPERPLSKAGLLAFTSYWQCMVSRALLNYWEGTEQIQYPALLDLLIEHLGMAKDDIEDMLVRLDLIKTDPKTKRLMLLKSSAKERLLEYAQKREKLKDMGRLIDLGCLKKDWLKKLPTRKLI